MRVHSYKQSWRPTDAQERVSTIPPGGRYEDLLQLEPADFVQAKVERKCAGWVLEGQVLHLAQADADITTAEAKNCILEQVQKEHEASDLIFSCESPSIRQICRQILESIPESIVVGLFEVGAWPKYPNL